MKEDTKLEFEKSFHEGSLYNRQTRDEDHRNLLIDMLRLKEGMTVLDLGTGSAYIGMEIARRFSFVNVIGIDIVEQTLQMNKRYAQKQQLSNVEFISYSGDTLPFEDEKFDRVISRYALHHFTDIKGSFQEVSRVLKKKGMFIISDPTPNEEDETRFVDDYMRMKKDGHQKFYQLDELKTLAKEAGMFFVSNTETKIRFPRIYTKDYEDIIKVHNEKIIESYHLEHIGEEQWISERVINAVFLKGENNEDE